MRGLKTFARDEVERRAVIDVVPALELAINMAYNEIHHRARLVKMFGTAPLIAADDARLGQVFLNLLVNAAQAIPEGRSEVNEIRIRVVVSGQQLFLGKPEAEISAEKRLVRLAVGSDHRLTRSGEGRERKR